MDAMLLQVPKVPLPSSVRYSVDVCDGDNGSVIPLPTILYKGIDVDDAADKGEDGGEEEDCCAPLSAPSILLL